MFYEHLTQLLIEGGGIFLGSLIYSGQLPIINSFSSHLFLNQTEKENGLWLLTPLKYYSPNWAPFGEWPLPPWDIAGGLSW